MHPFVANSALRIAATRELLCRDLYGVGSVGGGGMQVGRIATKRRGGPLVIHGRIIGVPHAKEGCTVGSPLDKPDVKEPRIGLSASVG